MAIMSADRVDQLMAVIQKRRATLEAAAMSVINGYTPACFVWGPPGLGKSHLLLTLLDENLKRGWRHHTGHATPKALMLALADAPAAVHLFEDCEPLLRSEHTAGILRAACGAPDDRDRWVTWERADAIMKVKFQGGIIVATNANLARANGPMQGVASRFRPLRWDMSPDERVACILDMARRGHSKCSVPLAAAECRQVAVELIEMAADSRCESQLDLRLFTEHALPAFAQAQIDEHVDWRELVLAKLMGVVRTNDETQADRTNRLQDVALKIFKEVTDNAKRLLQWKEMTGLGQSIYYRHLKAAKRREHGTK